MKQGFKDIILIASILALVATVLFVAPDLDSHPPAEAVIYHPGDIQEHDLGGNTTCYVYSGGGFSCVRRRSDCYGRYSAEPQL